MTPIRPEHTSKCETLGVRPHCSFLLMCQKHLRANKQHSVFFVNQLHMSFFLFIELTISSYLYQMYIKLTFKYINNYSPLILGAIVR